jgi:predicted glycosyltransferase
MNIFANISHPAHVHFFKNAIVELTRRGHNIIIGARQKEFTRDLLTAYNLSYTPMTKKGRGLIGLIKELLIQQVMISRIIKRSKVDLMVQIGGIFNAPVGRCYGIPTLAFSDTENDRWGNTVSFGVSSHVLSPAGGHWRNQILYPGYHELAYLSPRYAPKVCKPDNRFLVRFVGWGAGHDIGEHWLSDRQKVELVRTLESCGPVHVSSEMPLPSEILHLSCKIHPSEIHGLMKECKLVVGESATMASEAACLGIPALFLSNTGRGYTTEEDVAYGLIKHYRLNQWEDIMATLTQWASRDIFEEWQEKRWRMLKEKMDVTPWMIELIENYPASIEDAKQGRFERYAIECAA